MMKKHIGRILAGLVLIAIAVFLTLGALGIGIRFPAGIALWQWIAGGLLLWLLIDGVRRLALMQTFLMLGFEVMVFEAQLGMLFGFPEKNWISNWLVFGVSVLLGCGFSMIFKGFRVSVYKTHNTMGSTVKYIDSANLKTETLKNKMGEMEVRFENVADFSGEATLHVHNSLGETRVYIPSTWAVRIRTSNSLGEIHIDPHLTHADSTEESQLPVLNVKASNSLGELQILVQ